MPNWCDNELHIKGPDEDILDLVNQLEENAQKSDRANEDYSFTDTFMPKPKIFHQRQAPEKDEEKAKQALHETGHKDWYDWANDDDNWGTKWGDCDTDIWVTEERIGGTYQTAWSPLSIPFWTEVSKCYPTLIIAIGYREEGMAYEGAYAFYNGINVYDHSAETSPYLAEALAMAESFAVEPLAKS